MKPSAANSNARAFYVLLVTQTVSLLGSRMSGFAIGIWLFKQTGNVTPLALVFAFETVPMLLFSNVAGVFVDRWSRGHVLILANAGQAVATLILMISFLSGQFQVWHLYAIVAFQAVFAALLFPAFQSSITLLIPDKHRDRANAINQMTGPMAGVFAPALATALYAVVNVGGVVAIDMISFVIAGLAPLFIKIPRPPQSAEGREMRGSVLQEIAGGFRFLWSRKILFFLVLYASGLNFFFNGVLTLNTPYLLARTNSEAALGIATSLMSAGGILGGIIMGIWGGTRPRIHTIFPGMILSGIAMALYGLSQMPVTLSLSLFAVMFPLPFVNAAFFSILQIKVPSDLQGRVFAVVTQLAMLLSPVANLVVGPLADRVFEPAVGAPGWNTVAALVGGGHGAGMGLMALIGGASVALLTAVVYLVPATRHMEQTLPDYKSTDSAVQATPVEPTADVLPETEAGAVPEVA